MFEQRKSVKMEKKSSVKFPLHNSIHIFIFFACSNWLLLIIYKAIVKLVSRLKKFKVRRNGNPMNEEESQQLYAYTDHVNSTGDNTYAI